MRRMLVVAVVAVLLLAPAVASSDPIASASNTCSDYSNQAAAQRAADTRDPDGDGVYCESLPCPCAKPGSSGGGDNGAARRRAAQRRAAARRRAARRRAVRRRAARRRAAARRKAAKVRRFRRDIHRSRARITDVTDGDTVKIVTAGSVNRRFNVRLIGLDTPETKKPGVAVECGGKQATATMFNLAFTAARDTDGDGLLDTRGGTGLPVTVTTDPSQDLYDRYGRLLAYLDVAGNVRAPGVGAYDLSNTMIAGGWAETYEYGSRPPQRLRRYSKSEDRAMNANAGAWGLCGGDFHSAQ